MKEKLNPKMSRVTLRQLRGLTAIIDAGTVTGAAMTLNVTAPAVSQQLRQLEAVAGMPLYERTDNGFRPTDAGKELLDTASRIENAIHECGEALETLAGIEGGRVAVGIVSTAKYFAPMVLAAFIKEHRKVDVQLQVGNRAAVMAALRGLEVDFAVTGRPPDDIKIQSTAIAEHPHIIIAPPDHPFARRKHMPFAKLAEETFLLRERGSGTRLLMKRLFSEAGLSPNLGMEIGSNETIKQAVIAGLGVALISAHTVAAEIDDGRLAVLKVRGLPIVRTWFVVKREEKRLLPAAQALWDFFVNTGAEILERLSEAKPERQRQTLSRKRRGTATGLGR